MSTEVLLLERKIERAFDAVLDADTDDQLRAAWFEMRILIAQRSPLTVGRMERARGLRSPAPNYGEREWA